jgi:pimeloyl-ACP methyl ester carboxylesterase
MPRITSFDGTELYYEDVGEGRPVVLAHGWSASHEFFDPQIAALRDDYRMIGVDLRGHGKSSKSADEYGHDAHCRDLEYLMSELELEDPTLIGWSWGGGIATRYAGSFGTHISQLGLIGPAAPKFIADDEFPHGLPEEEVMPLLEMEKNNRPDYRHTVYNQAVHQEIDEAAHDYMWELSMQTPTWTGVPCFEALLEEDMTDDVTNIDVPTRIFNGDQDAFCPAEGAHWMAERIDEADVVEYSDVGHTPHWEITDTFNEDLRAFLDEY